MLAKAGVLVAATYYALRIRHQTKLRQTEMVMGSYATFGSTEFQRAYQTIRNLEFEDYANYLKRYEKDVEVRAATWTVTIFFEGIGICQEKAGKDGIG